MSGIASFRPRRMKRVEITVLERDLSSVLEFLGRKAVMQFAITKSASRDKAASARDSETARKAAAAREHIESAASSLGVELPAEPDGESRPLPPDALSAIDAICREVEEAEAREHNAALEKERLLESLAALQKKAAKKGVYGEGGEKIANALSKLRQSPFLSLKIGHLDSGREAAQSALGERALIIPIGEEGEVLAVSSRLGRFALDSELKKQRFQAEEKPVSVETVVPQPSSQAEMEAALLECEEELQAASSEKIRLSGAYGERLRALYASALMTGAMEDIRGRLVATKNAYMLSGWIESAAAENFTKGLENVTGGRIALLSWDPGEREEVREGRERVPTLLKNGRFAAAFEPVVLSYGAPPYMAIDPTPITAFLFTLLFAVMFGDVGQGLVLFLLGILAGNREIKIFDKYRHFSGPLKACGLASAFAGLLYGGFFSNETLLEAPTKAVTGFLENTGFGRALGIHECEKIVNVMPQAGNLTKLFYFFAFTLGIGVITISLGIILNIINNWTLGRRAKALYSRNGLAGLAFFWYAVSIGLRAIFASGGGGVFKFTTFDMAALIIPVFFIVTGPFWARLFSGRRPLFEEGVLSFVIEGVVEILETLSGYISNTVSFLRVGAFALSHAVLSFIIFTMAEKVDTVTLGTFLALLIVVFGNAVIIVLEGMIVAIQVTRLQYYEFFSKFFTETGSEFSPFRFRKSVEDFS